MKIICKHPIASFTGTLLFLVDKEYNVEKESASKQLLVKDEQGGLRWFPSDDKFFKQHFKIVKE